MDSDVLLKDGLWEGLARSQVDTSRPRVHLTDEAEKCLQLRN
jgi:hypothetical protein